MLIVDVSTQNFLSVSHWIAMLDVTETRVEGKSKILTCIVHRYLEVKHLWNSCLWRKLTQNPKTSEINRAPSPFVKGVHKDPVRVEGERKISAWSLIGTVTKPAATPGSEMNWHWSFSAWALTGKSRNISLPVSPGRIKISVLTLIGTFMNCRSSLVFGINTEKWPRGDISLAGQWDT